MNVGVGEGESASSQGGKNSARRIQLNETGIRKLRREKVFTTPNVNLPIAFEQKEIEDDPDFREVVEPQNCYVCKKNIPRFTISTTSFVRSARN